MVGICHTGKNIYTYSCCSLGDACLILIFSIRFFDILSPIYPIVNDVGAERLILIACHTFAERSHFTIVNRESFLSTSLRYSPQRCYCPGLSGMQIAGHQETTEILWRSCGDLITGLHFLLSDTPGKL